jgi:hypothetical protein
MEQDHTPTAGFIAARGMRIDTNSLIASMVAEIKVLEMQLGQTKEALATGQRLSEHDPCRRGTVNGARQPTRSTP